MDRRSFLKKGTALAALGASAGTVPAYNLDQVYAATDPGTAPVEDSGSSVVTQDELQASRLWHAAISAPVANQSQATEWFDDWLGTARPFSFRYGGESSASLLAKWQLHKEDTRGDSQWAESNLTWREPENRLQVRWQVKRAADFPAI